MTPNLGTMPIDINKLMESRMLLVASSGSGKSWALRRVLEQTVAHVQQLIIDPEGEFASLRERFDYIVCAPRGADAVATPQTAAALATALWKAGTSAILDISELKAHERVLFVKRFLETLIAMPREFWHQTMVVIDEAHLFCPQTGNSESAQAVIDLATRGRKRGLCLVAATTRIAKVDKDALAELKNKLIGGMSLDVDVKRAADELGLTPRDATEKLRALTPGDFFAFGPALSPGVTVTRIGAIVTTHPKAGQGRLAAPPPPSANVRAQLAKIEGLKVDAEVEEKTVASLTAEVTKLRRQLTISSAPAAAPGVSEAEVRRRIDEAVANVPREDVVVTNAFTEALAVAESLAKRIVEAAAGVRAIEASRKSERVGQATQPRAAQPRAAPSPSPKSDIPPRVKPAPATAVNSSLSGPEQRIVDAIAWLEALGIEEPEQPAVAFLADYKFGGGAFNNPKGRLNQRGLVEYRPQGCMRLTEAGRALANKPEAAGSNEELHERVLARLSGPEQRILRPLLNAYPRPMPNGELASLAGYTAGAGAFNNPKGKLRTLGLIDYPEPGHAKARGLLFPILD